MRGGTAVPDRSDGWSALFAARRANHPYFGTGRAAFNVRLEELDRREPRSSSHQVRLNPPALPKLLRTNEDAVDPQGIVIVCGHPQDASPPRVMGAQLGCAWPSFGTPAPKAAHKPLDHRPLMRRSIRTSRPGDL